MLAIIFIPLAVLLLVAILLAGNIDVGGSDRKQWYSLGLYDGQHFGRGYVTDEFFRGYWMLFLWRRTVLKAYQQGVTDGIRLNAVDSK